ncbi:MFS transporter [Xylanimonas ulmi]|uniref:Sugar phosphate permease n=1 Tax=Xylanimonas ulmi TaxID=228973 RepID=A0A4Q7M4S8_9MICO|nr:MFS transporter [Xylanibacterium ulmi]RZS62956.1 sugar phosphate permease [Xylanibacterium ulmi]
MSNPVAGASAAIPQKRWVYVIPVAAIMYMLAYLDRNNVAVILPFIDQDGGMTLSVADKGLVTGIFFVGYMVLQIPGAVLAQKWSAKKTVLILMILWGLAAISCGLVNTRGQFLVARFFLGVFEGGVWPAVLVLLASWFPLKERARANALWMACLPISSVIMAPLSGILLDFFSWRAVLMIEGVPPLVWAVVWWFAMSDNPAQARWVSAAERAHVESALAEDEAAKPYVNPKGGYRRALRNSRVWLLILIYFCWMSGFYGFSLWLPTVLKELTGGSPTLVGWLTAIPFGLALGSMIMVSRWSDTRQDRRLAVAVPLLVGAGALVAGQFVHTPAANIVLLCVAAMAIYAPYGPFWAIPAEFLRIEVLAFSMGLINALGNLGGFLGPYAVGYLKEATGSDLIGYLFLAGLLALAALVTLRALRTGATAPSEPVATDSVTS